MTNNTIIINTFYSKTEVMAYIIKKLKKQQFFMITLISCQDKQIFTSCLIFKDYLIKNVAK